MAYNDETATISEESAPRIRAWAQALREWPDELRGRKRLRDSRERTCALGVACDLTGLGEWVKQPPRLKTPMEMDPDRGPVPDIYVYRITDENSNPPIERGFPKPYNQETENYLPKEVIEWYGLNVDQSIMSMSPTAYQMYQNNKISLGVNLCNFNDNGISWETLATILEEVADNVERIYAAQKK